MNRKERLSSCRLYGIADMGYTAEHQLISVTEKLLAGGLGILQLRAKNHDPEHIARMGSRLAPLCREYGCLFIINDYPEIALGTGRTASIWARTTGNWLPCGPCWGRTPSSGVPRTARNRLWARSGIRRTTSDSAPCFPRHQAGKAGDRPGRHCRRAAAITGRVSRLLHRRH